MYLLSSVKVSGFTRMLLWCLSCGTALACLSIRAWVLLHWTTLFPAPIYHIIKEYFVRMILETEYGLSMQRGWLKRPGVTRLLKVNKCRGRSIMYWANYERSPWCTKLLEHPPVLPSSTCISDLGRHAAFLRLITQAVYKKLFSVLFQNEYQLRKSN